MHVPVAAPVGDMLEAVIACMKAALRELPASQACTQAK